jgi:hypothetical protein
MIRVVHPRSGSLIRILIFLLIPEPGSRGPKGTGSRIRIRNTDLFKIPLLLFVQETTARGTRAAETIVAAQAKNSKLSTIRSPVRTGLQAEGVHTMYTNTSRKQIAPSGHTFPCSLFVCCLCDIFKRGLLG